MVTRLKKKLPAIHAVHAIRTTSPCIYTYVAI
jgi:hypothetical protein